MTKVEGDPRDPDGTPDLDVDGSPCERGLEVRKSLEDSVTSKTLQVFLEVFAWG